VAVCGYLEPLSAVVLSAVFLKETLMPIQIAGAVLIIGGAVFAEMRQSKNVSCNDS
jgi:drug/metabolite transporter (DMT)-like permease